MDTVGREVLGPLLGRRVSLRHRVGERAGRPLYTDVVGELSAVDEALVVDTRKGPVRVARDAVVAVRAVPGPVPRRASWAAVARLENLCADAWPARVDQPLGAWRLRAAGGFTGRANAALAVGDPGLPVPAALDAVRAFAAEHGVPPRVQAPVGSRWDRAVAAAGWVLDTGHEAGAEVAVLVADLEQLAAGDDRRSIDGSGQSRCFRRRTGDHASVELSDRPTDAWWALALGRDPIPDERSVLDPGGALLTAFGLVRGSGVLRAAVVGDHLHLSRLHVHPDARRAGVASTLTAAAAAWGRGHGARWAVLQVALHNTAARDFYDRLGATEHHRYRYLVSPT